MKNNFFLIKTNDNWFSWKREKEKKLQPGYKWKPGCNFYLFGVLTNKRGNTISLTQQGIQTERNKKMKIAM